MATRNLSFGPVTFGGGTTTIAEFSTEQAGCQRAGITVTNSAGSAAAFAVFQLQVISGKSIVYTIIASIAGDFSTPLSPLLRTVGTPVTLAVGATAFLLMDIHGIAQVRIQAQSAGTSIANVDVSIG